MRLLIKNGVAVREDGACEADILVEDGLIQAVGDALDAPGAQVLDAKGCYVFPGFIDPHTHFNLAVSNTVTADDFHTGTRAAILGGTTTIIDFADQERGVPMAHSLDKRKEQARGSHCHYAFHMALSEWSEEVGDQMPAMVAAGVTSCKMYMVYGMRVDDGEIYRAMKRAKDVGALVSVHCENYALLCQLILEQQAEGNNTPMGHALSRPSLIEAEAVHRFLRIAELAKSPAYVVHLSTAEGLDAARRARARGQEVYLETCPQYLLLDSSRYMEPDGAKYVMSPPLRSVEDNARLWQGLKENDIDTVGTDHCSFTMAQKALGAHDFTAIPNGAAGVQTRAALIFTYGVKAGLASLSEMAAQLSTNAAKIFGMYPKKGVLAPGSDADIVIWEPTHDEVLSHKALAHNCDNTPFEGMRVSGRARDVILGGVHAVRGGELIREGLGGYVPRGKPLGYRV